MLSKLLSIMNASSPLHATLESYQSTFSRRLRLPRCTTECHRRSFLPVAINSTTQHHVKYSQYHVQYYFPTSCAIFLMSCAILSMQYYHATLPFIIMYNIHNILFIMCNTSSYHYYYYYHFITLQLLPNSFCRLNILSYLYFYTSTRT